MILTVRTDKPESEIGLFNDDAELAYIRWQAHRQLAETIHLRIKEILDAQGWTLGDISGIVAYKGPGSFTGLRIGISAVNALAYSLDIPIVGTTGDDWIKDGLIMMKTGKDDHIVIPEYGGSVNVTKPKK